MIITNTFSTKIRSERLARQAAIHRFSLGAWHGSPAPYGFDLIKITDEGRWVFSLSANGQAGK